MNKHKLNEFLKFSSVHPVGFRNSFDIWFYCDEINCEDCIFHDYKTCDHVDFTDSEYNYVKSNYPEYFV